MQILMIFTGRIGVRNPHAGNVQSLAYYEKGRIRSVWNRAFGSHPSATPVVWSFIASNLAAEFSIPHLLLHSCRWIGIFPHKSTIDLMEHTFEGGIGTDTWKPMAKKKTGSPLANATPSNAITRTCSPTLRATKTRLG